MLNDVTTTTLTTRDLEDDARAGNVFHEMLRHGAQRPHVLALIGQDPATALATLSRGSEALGLTSRGGADVLDEIIGAVGDDVRARQLMRDNVSHARMVEMLRARGDLASAAAEIAEPEAVLEAILEDLRTTESHNRATMYGLILMGWALKLRDRQDYQTLLQTSVMDRPLIHWLAGTVWYETIQRTLAEDGSDASEPDDDDDDEDSPVASASDSNPDDGTEEAENLLLPIEYERSCMEAFNGLGIDPSEGVDLIRELLRAGQLEELDPRELDEARSFVQHRRTETESAPQTVASKEAETLDF